MVGSRVIATAVGLAVAAGAGVFARESSPQAPECYRLAYGVWVPSIRHDALASSLPPTDIELATASSARGRPKCVVPQYIAKPEAGEPQWAYWRDHGAQGVSVIWSTGLAGVALFLRNDDEGVLRGKAKHFFDDGQIHEADVTATRIDCPVDCKGSAASR